MEKLPVWLNEGTKPTSDYIDNGWRPEYKAPASYLNWMMNKSYRALEELQAHEGSFVSEEGRHGMRYWNGCVYAKIDDQWIRITKVPSITMFEGESMNNSVVLVWKNPVDDTFSRIIIRYKIGEYPTSVTDGYLAYEGDSETVIVKNLINDEEYYFRAFTVSVKNTMNDTLSGQTLTMLPARDSKFGVKIDTTNANPESALTYIDGAVESIPAQTVITLTGYDSGGKPTYSKSFSYGSWRKRFPFKDIKPCLFSNGKVVGYLDPYDFTKFDDGTTSTNNGDVMIEFPKIYWKIERVGTDVFVRYSKFQLDSSYKCLAHMRGTVEKDFIYISAYQGYTVAGKTKSMTGVSPTNGKFTNEFRTLAKANGAGYEMVTYHQLLMLQVLFLVMFKNRDSQTALGKGLYDENLPSIRVGRTGALDKKGMFWGDTMTTMDRVKFCGIEDLWGNLDCSLDGISVKRDGSIVVANTGFNDNYTGYDIYPSNFIANARNHGYVSDVTGTTEVGFVAGKLNGSQTTHYADVCSVSLENNVSNIGASFGGEDGSSMGMFRLTVDGGASLYKTSRISYY
ncbi:fibronectin type III domain-containing protein [Sporosarcina sp. P17b]|uniref:fibronectin type III domain-containing protein n=1 Tax=Sporosarcina sp. P17b TaxID=2048260 RepID=UPI000C16E434|nr:fibronectin type III domain-containing protein [Sporosarcina sp. P17b]PIC73352.1 hypothetical protein CSV76_11080 [Sporosarcina sp. P17b]